MDLKHYFRKLREIEAGISTANTFVVSLETSDGGKAGIVTEVKREIAAKMIVEGRAVLAGGDEKQAFLKKQHAERAAIQRAEAAKRMQVTLVPSSEAEQSFSQNTTGSKK